MIHRLRKKLIIVLMTVLSLLLLGILLAMFISAKTNFEHQSLAAFDEQMPSDQNITDQLPSDESFDPGIEASMAIASVQISETGELSIIQNQIHYLSDEDLLEIVASLELLLDEREDTTNFGITSDYNLRYQRYINPDGTEVISFSDTYIERDTLQAQIWFSIVIGIGALGLFLVASILLSRWMVKPVERAWEKQRRFVTDASHELKTPLTVILSNTDMLIDSGVLKDSRNKARLDNIKAESHRMRALTESLLTLARSDSKPMSVTKEDVDFSYIITTATLIFEPTIYDLGRAIHCDIADKIMIVGDKEKLRRLVDILIDNAIQYGEKETPIHVSFSMSGKKEAILKVSSIGTPLTPEELTHIFERFYRVDDSRGQTKGFGLGLSIAHSIIEEHHGKIWAESDGKKINTFFVKLPVKGSSN